MSKSKIFLKNKLLLLVVIAIIMFASGLTLINANHLKSIFANEIFPYNNLNNGNFTLNKDNNKPASPKNWTLCNQLPSNVKAGIIDLNPTVFKENQEENYNLSSAPTTYSNITEEDSKILMINSRTGKANVGYKSDSFELKNNSYYSISVWAYSQLETNTFGTIVLNNENLTKNNSFTVSTSGQWKEYMFFVKTNSINSLENCNLQLWLGKNDNQVSAQGSSGAIFFDNIKINELDSQSFKALYNACENTSTTPLIIDLQNNYENIIENANFENDLNDSWVPVSFNDTNLEDENILKGIYYIDDQSNNYVKNILKVDTAPTDGNFLNNHKALLLNSLKKEESFGYESKAFSLDENSIYKLTIWTKSKIKTGNAQIVLIEQPFNQNDEYFDNLNENLKTFTLNVSNSAENSKTNNWIENSFYISTRTFSLSNKSDYSFNLKLQLLLGNEETPAKGYVFFDNITLEKITSADLETAISNGGNIKEANFNSESNALLNNGGFNSLEINYSEYPYAPKNWTLNSDIEEFYQLNGVINTSEDKYLQFRTNIQTKIDNNELSSTALSVSNPLLNSKYPENNVLMIGTLKNGYQYYESDKITLNKNSYYSLSVSVNTFAINNGFAGLRLVNANNTVVGEILKISTNENWNNYLFNIKTGDEDTEIKLQLNFGLESKGTGFACFDNVKLITSSEEDYDSTSSVYYTKTRKVNLSQDDFTNISYDKNLSTGFYTPYGWKFETIETDYSELKYGVINTSENNQFTSPEQASNSNILYLNAINSDTYLGYSTEKEYKIAQNSYYKISVWVKTENLAHYSDKDGEYGASFLVESQDGSFKGFKGVNTNEEWQEYSIFVNSSDETTFKIYLTLGNTKNSVRGSVYFSTLNFQSIDETSYIEGVKELENSSTINNVMAIGNTDVKKENTEDETTSNNFNFDLTLLSSIITAVAIIVAIAGLCIRKFHHKKPVKIGKGDYDRTLIMKKVKEQEQKISSNNLKLEELRKQLENIKNEISLAKAEYKQEIANIEDSFKNELVSLASTSTASPLELKLNEEVENKLSASEINEIKKQNKVNSNIQEKLSQEEFDNLLKEIDKIKANNQLVEQQRKEIETLKTNAKTSKENKKEDRKKAYEIRRKALIEQYNLVEKQIELLYQEELELIKEYKLYKKQVKFKKLEIKENKKKNK